MPLSEPASESRPLSLHAEVSSALRRWPAPDLGQGALREAFLGFLAARPDATHRSCEPGHITASAVVLSADRREVLLTLHPRIGRWVQLGGHCEPEDATIADAALREATEESGIAGLHHRPVAGAPGRPSADLLAGRADQALRHPVPGAGTGRSGAGHLRGVRRPAVLAGRSASGELRRRGACRAGRGAARVNAVSVGQPPGVRRPGRSAGRRRVDREGHPGVAGPDHGVLPAGGIDVGSAASRVADRLRRTADA